MHIRSRFFGQKGQLAQADLISATTMLGRQWNVEEGQEAVVSRLLAGRSVLAIFPTGHGKSLCFQLPALLLDGFTLVISPLIALMKDDAPAL